MAELLYYPILILLLILQTAILRHIPFLGGSADLMLLWLVPWGLHPRGKFVWVGAVFAALLYGFVSATQWYVPLLSYLFVALSSRFLSKRFWQNPLIALFFITFFASIFEGLLSFASLYISGSAIEWGTALRSVIIPSVFLNMLFTLPMYALFNDMASWVYPFEERA